MDKISGTHFFYSSGRINQNVEPLPNSLFTPILPPNCSMMLLLMESPSPVPCTKEFSLMKRSKTLLQASGAMPMPVSATYTRKCFSSGLS